VTRQVGRGKQAADPTRVGIDDKPSRGQDVVSISASFKKMKVFLSETRSELKKVTFPARDEVISTTVVVIITSIIFAFYLWMVDIVIIKVYEGIIRVLG